MAALALGEFIRKRRDELDISLRELARRLDITPPFLSDIELGKRYPSEDVLKEIAEKLEVALEELKQFDFRESINDLKRLMERDPDVGVAFRRLIEGVNSGRIKREVVEKAAGSAKK